MSRTILHGLLQSKRLVLLTKGVKKGYNGLQKSIITFVF